MLRRLWPIAVGLVLLVSTGCLDQPTPAEVSTLTTLEAAPAAIAVACDFKNLDQSIRAYFSGRDKRPAADLAKALEAAYTSGSPVPAQAAGFDLLRYLAGIADAGAGKSAAAASDVANATLACMSVGFSQSVDFVGAFGGTGYFSVKGGAGDSPSPAITRDHFSGVAPPPAGWASWLGGPTVFYGQRVSTFVSGEEVIFAAVDWSIIQGTPQALTGNGVVGLCVNNPTDAFRIQEDAVILPLVDPLFLGCPTLASGAPAPTTLAGRLLQAVGDWFAPQPLHAAVAFGGTGGTAGGFSRFGVVNAGAVNLTFVVQPSDASTGTVITPPVEVRATGNGGTGLPDVAVSVTTVLNNGTPLELLGTTTVVTGSDGIARFTDLRLTKPGVVILQVSATTPGYPTATMTSQPFHITDPLGGK